jgi:hypothetical protein
MSTGHCRVKLVVWVMSCIRSLTELVPVWQKLAQTSPISVGRSVGIVRSRTKATEYSFFGGSVQMSADVTPTPGIPAVVNA